MFTPTTFYPAKMNVTTGAQSLFTDGRDTATEATSAVQKSIDNNCFGTDNHVVSGFAYFNEANDIVYVFAKQEDYEISLASVKRQVITGATSKYAKLKDLKKSTVKILKFLNRKKLADKVIKVTTFKQLGVLLNE